MRTKPNDCVLLITDVQDRLIDTISEHEVVVKNTLSLIRATEVLRLPVLATEQDKLGETVTELKTLLSRPALRKLSFSCCGSREFMKSLKQTGKKTVIACGIETHICVLQTVLDLLEHHYRVLVVRDATSSHTMIDRETAIERMKAAGATITTTEALIYELTERAGTKEFRNILEIVKETRGKKLQQLKNA
jgi:isochorismate hydrolase